MNMESVICNDAESPRNEKPKWQNVGMKKIKKK